MYINDTFIKAAYLNLAALNWILIYFDENSGIYHPRRWNYTMEEAVHSISIFTSNEILQQKRNNRWRSRNLFCLKLVTTFRANGLIFVW